MAGDLLPYLKFYPAETLADERFAAWTAEERGAWLSLLFHAWVNGSIPSDLPSLARISHVHPRSMERVWRTIGDRFVPLSDGRLTSKRLESERSEARAKSDAGRSGANARWNRERNPAEPLEAGDAVASGDPMPTTQSNAEQHNAEQRSAPQSARKARVGVGHPAFVAIGHWTKDVWPKTSTAQCPDVTTSQAQSLAALCGRHTPEVVVAAMDRAAADPFWADKLDLDTFIAKFGRFLHDAAPPAKQQVTAAASERSAFRKGEVAL